MSFARWSETSDVYIFEHIGILGITCFGCLLMPSSYDENHDLDEFENYNTRSLQEFLQHLQEHRVKGYKIPDDLESKLKERWPFEA